MDKEELDSTQGFIDGFGYVDPSVFSSESTVLSTIDLNQWDASLAPNEVDSLFDNYPTWFSQETLDALNSVKDKQSVQAFSAPPSPQTASIHFALSADAHLAPQKLAEYDMPVDTSNPLVIVNDVNTLDAALAMSFVRMKFEPTFQTSLWNEDTWLASAMEPPTTESPLNRLSNFRPICRLADLDKSINDVSQKLFALDTNAYVVNEYLTDRAPFFPLIPSTFHFVLLLIDPALCSPTYSVALSATLKDPTLASLTLPATHPAFFVPPSPISSSSSLQSSSTKPQRSSTKPKRSGSIPRKSRKRVVHLSSSNVAVNIDDACNQVHGFVQTEYRLKSTNFIDIVREWKFTYDILAWLGYEPKKGLQRHGFRWSDGHEETFKEIIEQLGWTARDFSKKSKLYLWADQASATQTWDPHTVPAPNEVDLTDPYPTWRRIVYLWRHTVFLSGRNDYPDPESENLDEADLVNMRQEHVDSSKELIMRNLIPRSS
ncbi:hypothetical protein FB446DRAFT_708140 [Lentinula raphanica]|nr:hypothetical protein FB446DRAFT_708140 [Lentinula raphanica]